MICSIGKPPLYISSLERHPLDSTLVFIVFTKRVGKCGVHKLSSLFSIPSLGPGINLYHYSKIPPERLNCSMIFFFGFILFHHACSILQNWQTTSPTLKALPPASIVVCFPFSYPITYFSFLTGKASPGYGKMVGSFVPVTIEGRVGKWDPKNVLVLLPSESRSPIEFKEAGQ